MKAKQSADWLGMLIGFLAFAAGIGLLIYTFMVALELFSVPPDQAIGITKDKAVDLAKTGSSLVSVVIKIVLLMVMAGVGSMISNRGIKMYVSARAIGATKPMNEAPIEKSPYSADL